MSSFCESGCGGMVLVVGNKWCPQCHPEFSMGQSLNLPGFVVVAGKYESVDGEASENVKFISEPMPLEAAETELKRCEGYHFSRIEYHNP